jgi:FlaA1/EpsC-like NDP-sugar epimerase
MLIFTAVSYLGFEKEYSLSRLMLLYFYVLSTAAIVFERAAVREVLREVRRRGYNLRHVLVVGDGDLARGVAERMALHPELGLKVRGFLTDDPARVGVMLGAAPVLGVWDEVSEIVSAGGIDQVVMALPFERTPHLDALLGRLDSAVVDVKVVPDIERFVSLKSGIEDFDGLPVISLRATPLAGWGRVVKRGWTSPWPGSHWSCWRRFSC